MAVRCMVFIALLSLTFLSFGQPPLARYAEQAAEQLAKAVGEQKVKLAFGAFSVQKDGVELPSPMMAVFQSFLADALQRSGKFILLQADEAKLKELVKEWKLAESGLTAEQKQRLGKLFGADAILFGTAMETQHRVVIRLELTDVETRAVTTVTVSVVKDELNGAALYPKTTESLQQALDELRKPTTTLPLKVKVNPERLNGVYYEGEEVRIYLWANQPCYLWLFYVDASGRWQLLLPNPYRRDNFFQFSNDPILFPSEKEPFRFLVVPPFGTEMFLVYASTAPLPTEEVERLLRQRGQKEGMRGIVQGMRGLLIAPHPSQKPVFFDEDYCTIITLQK
jgi:hypothetical protein